MALVIPDFFKTFDIQKLVELIAPRELLVVSAAGDKYSRDADRIVDSCRAVYEKLGKKEALSHHRYSGGHPLDSERFEKIVSWIAERN